MAIPAARRLHDSGFEIYWTSGRAATPLLQCYSWINTIPVDDEAILKGDLIRRIRAIAAFWRRVTSNRYELCATLYSDVRFRVITFPVRAKRKISLSRNAGRESTLLPGRSHTDEWVRLLLNMDMCGEQSCGPVAPDTLPPSPLPAKVSPRRIALVPGGAANLIRKQILRRWPIGNYVALAEIYLRRGWEVILIGGPEDMEFKGHFQDLPVTDSIGTLSLPQLISVFNSCDGVVSHDTGPMHVAGLSRACLIGLFGPTDPAMFLPRRPLVTAVWGGQNLSCRPCYDGREFAPCTLNECMHQVDVKRVMQEMDQLLEKRACFA